MKLLRNTILFISFIFFLSGCGTAQQSIYYWDKAYINSVYNYINEEGDINEQISSLEKTIQETYSNNKKIAPGLYAQLGLLYSKIGNENKSIMYLDKEKETFPESTKYINFLKKKGAK